jgi:acyl-CoA hydrolase
MRPRQSLKRQTYMATRAPDNAYRDEETMEPGSYQLSIMVAVDAAGRPSPVRPLLPDTLTERRRYAQGQLRRQQRQELQARYDEIRELGTPR